jgi:hypothetical protein
MQKIDWDNVAGKAKTMSNEELAYAIRDCWECVTRFGNDEMFGKDANYYRDEASVYQQELDSRKPKPPKFDCDLKPLAEAISFADRESHYAQVNLGSSAQLGKIQRLENLRYAFALVTGTAVGGMIFESKLKALIEGKNK